MPAVFSDALANSGSAWVLQMGFFAQRENAQVLKKQLVELGFDARVVASGGAGEQRFRVITGHAAAPEGLNSLRRLVEEKTGTRGFTIPNPNFDAKTESAEEVFAAPRAAYLLAQARDSVPAGGESIGSNASHGHNTNMFRTAQQEVTSSAGFTAFGLQFIPSVGLSLGYDDNLTAASRDEIDSWFYMISPALRVELPSDHSVLALSAGFDWLQYPDSSIDDKDSWYLRGDFAWDVSTRQDLNLFAQYSEDADRRGEGRRQGDAGLIPLPPDEWKRFDFGGLWDYGAVGARGRLTLQAGVSDIQYTSNRAGRTPGERGTAALDRDWWYWGGTFYWRVAPKTSLLAEYLHTDISYDESTDFDSTEDSFLLGVKWDATARTSGTLKYGVQKKDFSDPARRNYDGPTWAAAVSWRPRTYSVFTLSGTRNTQEPDGNGDFVLRQDVMLSWLHSWSPRISTAIDLGYGEDDYRPNGRTDDLVRWGVSAHYTFSPHFRFGGSVRGYHRDSVTKQYDYDRRVYMISLEITL